MNTARVLVSAVLRSLISALVTKGYALFHRRRRLRRSGAPPPDPRPAGGCFSSFLSFVHGGKAVERPWRSLATNGTQTIGSGYDDGRATPPGGQIFPEPG